MGQRREEGSWPVHTDVLELQPGQSWCLVIEDGGGKGVLGIVVRNLEDERLQDRSMDRRVEDLDNIRSQLSILGAKMELAITVRGVDEGIGEIGQRTDEGLSDRERGSVGAVNEFAGTVWGGHVDGAPEAAMLESNVAPDTTDVGDGEPPEVDLETFLGLELLSQVKEDLGQDLGR